MVRAFAHGTMGFGSILQGGPIELFLVPASADVTKAVVCVTLCVMHIKEPLLLI